MNRQLFKGVYRFWNYCHNITYNLFDTRPKELDIVGQEILTGDKIGIRMNVPDFPGQYDILDSGCQEVHTEHFFPLSEKIGIRMNVACLYKIKDAIEFSASVSDLKVQQGCQFSIDIDKPRLPVRQFHMYCGFTEYGIFTG